MDDPNQPPWPPPRDAGSTFNPRTTWQEARRRVVGGYGPDPDQRVGDAERSEMADLLGKHYSDGRLDESEFRERLDQAMSAKTRRDLHGLLADLPPLGQQQIGPPPPPPRRRRRTTSVVLLVLLSVVMFTSIESMLWPYHVPWLLFAIVAFVLIRRHHWHSHNRYGDWYHGHHGPSGWGNPPPPPQRYGEGPAGTPPWV
jgi:hypothetical protein